MKENSKKAGIHLLEKGKRGIFRVIFSRSGLILVLLAVQVLFLFSIFHWFEAFLPHISPSSTMKYSRKMNRFACSSWISISRNLSSPSGK